MRKMRFCAIFFAMLLPMLLLTACGKKTEGPLNGEWAYIHDTGKTVLELKTNGKAVYKDKKYSYSTDDSFIKLSGGGEDLNLRYALTDGGFYLYEPEVYVYNGDSTPEGIYGTWVKEDGSWAFEFKKSGEFNEGGVVTFSGHFTEDASNGSITLFYSDVFKLDDTVLYIRAEGDKLYVEYPTKMVKTVEQ